MIEEQFVSFDTAKMLKEEGFDVPCQSFYRLSEKGSVTVWKDQEPHNQNECKHYYSRPTQALAARWIREVHKFHVFAKRSCDYSLLEHRWSYWIQNAEYDVYKDVEIGFSSYEEAFEAGLQKAIKLIKK